ncbi:MAG: hypothetical protein QW486_02230 [Candidatus Bathyarchaeia archaeon]|nr:hypothetical protein [Candidatus Bathyarchaeota archaeon]
MHSYQGYKQGIGDIKLNIFDDRIEIYHEKGYIKKSKKILKVIYFSEIDKIETNNNELIIYFTNNEIYNIIFQQRESLNNIYEVLIDIFSKVNDNANQKICGTMLADITKKSIYLIDLLFDVILNLNGKIVWKNLEKNLKDIKEVYQGIKSTYNKFVDLDFKEMERNIVDRNPEKIPMNVFNFIKMILSFYRSLDKIDDKDLIILKSKFLDFLMIVESAVLLNDIILGIIIGDGHVNEEIEVFINLTNSLSKKINITIERIYIINLFEELKFKAKDYQIINKIRDFLKDLAMRYLSEEGSRVSLL